MKKFLRTVDSISEWTARSGRWLLVALVPLVTMEVVLRYVFTKPTLWGYELHVMLAASAYVLAFSYTHKMKAHVRVDMIYAHLPPRGQALIDFLGTLFLFFPFIFLLCYVSWNWMFDAWATSEKMPITGWYPPAGPLRTVILYGLVLFAFQAVAQFIRDTHLLIRGKPYD